MNNTLQFVLAGICFAKPCGTLGKQQRIKLSWGKLANSSKHSLLHSVAVNIAGEGYHGYTTKVQAVTLLKNLTLPMAGTNHMAR